MTAGAASPRLSLTRCVRPTVGRRGWSTYTVLGFLGYGVASVLGGVLASLWELTLGERLVGLLAPPLGFLAAVSIATAIKGREWIVFYQAAVGAVAAVVGLGAAIGGDITRLVDLAVLGIGAFLAFGRLGCLHVACCHGRPARWGVRYGAAHVAAGFWRRWAGRTLFPVQLVESLASAALVAAALAASSSPPPGTAALVYTIGYGLVRFALELSRGDPVRPFAGGLSEAQWFCAATLAACALWRPSPWTLIPLGAVLAAAALLFARRRDRALLSPPHLHALDQVCDAVLADPAHARRETRHVAVSCHALPDGRLDWILSSTHPRWSAATARRLAGLLWQDAEIVEGRTPGVVHVVVASNKLRVCE